MMQLVELCRDLLRSLPRDLAKQVCVGCADIDTALAASGSLNSRVFALDDDLTGQQLSQIILLAAPTLDLVSVRVHSRNREDAKLTCMLWLDDDVIGQQLSQIVLLAAPTLGQVSFPSSLNINGNPRR